MVAALEFVVVVVSTVVAGLASVVAGQQIAAAAT